MIDDPIVAEVHRARRKIMQRCKGDWSKFRTMLHKIEVEHADRLVTAKPKRRQTKRKAG